MSLPFSSRLGLTASALALTAAVSLPTVSGLSAAPVQKTSVKKSPVKKTPAAKLSTKVQPVVLTEDERIVHALNRLAFGPRPGDIARIKSEGLGGWISHQLAPDGISDDAVTAKLSGLTLLQSSSDDLQLAYVSDTAAFLKQARAQSMAAGDTTMAGMPQLTPAQQQTLDKVQQKKLAKGISVQAVGELSTAKIIRAAESERQLQEVLTDFWGNHFNIDVKKGQSRTYKVADERDAIRPHVLGKFRDLLEASAKSPAMLFYLDNFRSTRTYEMAQLPPRLARRLNAPSMPNANGKIAKKKVGGLNENYGRELMELHTLGVDGGYTQRDVTEVARCFTGWTIDRQTGGFTFNARTHDPGEKHVLGVTIPAGGGIEDGEKVLDMVAASPKTAHHLAFELCQRFVADEPPTALVDRVTSIYLKTGGDLKEVTRAIITSPEFFSPQAYRAKIKSPFEFAVSAVRALGGSVDAPDPNLPLGRLRLVADGSVSTNANGGAGARFGQRGRLRSMAYEIAQMGQPLYSYIAPTGYPEDSREWVSSGALIARLNYTLALAGRQIGGVTLPTNDVLSGVPAENQKAVLDALGSRLLGGPLSPATRATLKKQIPPGVVPDQTKLVALVLGSPEFQRR